MNYFESINHLNSYKKNISATVVSDSGIGNKAIWSDNDLLYYDGPKEFWESKQDILLSIKDTCIITCEDNTIFVEIIHNNTTLIICGAGHISIPIITMGKMLGFHVTVIEDRPKFANNARAAGADLVICEEFENALDKLNGGADNYFIIVTRGHRHDQLCLEKILTKNNAYTGMIGSKSRVKLVKNAIVEKGFDKAEVESIHSPIGLSINAETPEEIAVAIIAEIIQVKNKNIRGIAYDKEILRTVLNNENREKALVTIIERKGSAPRGVGAKMLVFRDGTTLGTIGGGCVEANMFQHAKKCIEQNTCKVYEYDMTGREVEEEGMVCGGIIKILIETIS